MTVGALALRLFHLDRESLWLDEGYTLFFSRLPLNRLIVIGGAHEHPPLYYLVVHGLLAFRRWYLVIRVVSAVAGSLSVPVMYALGRRMFGWGSGLIAALLVAVSPFHVWWSRDGRAYELAGLWVLLSYLLLLRAIESPGLRRWGLYSIAVALALYSEYTTAFVLVPQVLLFGRAYGRRCSGSLVASWIAAGLLFVPWVGILWHDAASVAGDYWIPPPSWTYLQNTVLEFLGLITPCPNFPCVGPEATVPLVFGHETAIAIAGIALVVGGLCVGVIGRDLNLTVAALWVLSPFVIVLALATHRSLYLDRVFLDATFGFYLLLVGILYRARRSVLSICVVLVMAGVGVGSAANLGLVYSQTSNPDFRALAADLQSAYRPGQTIVYNPGVLKSLVQAYMPSQWHATREQLLWFHGYLDVPGWQQRFAGLKQRITGNPHVLRQLRYGQFDTILRNIQLRHAITGQRQLWLVTQDYAGVTDNRRWLDAHGYHLLLSEIYFGDARLELWDRDLPSQFGPVVLRPGFRTGWARSGVVVRGGRFVREQGVADLSRSFIAHQGMAYSVNVEYRALEGSRPYVHVQTFDRSGHVLGTMVDRFGGLLNSFPRTEWYDMPVNDVWLSDPFGFVAPRGTVRATIQIGTGSGTCWWRNIAVYRER